MKHLLSPEHSEVLERVAKSRALLAFDFDGTLAPITGRPDEARMLPRTRELFATVCRLYSCAVISDRSQRDTFRRLAGVRVKHVIGNHGIEPDATLGEFEVDTARAKLQLTHVLAEWPGIDIEDKRYSLAIHYRRAADRRRTHEAIRHSVSALPVAMRIVPGRFVVNVLPARAPNKGDALACLRAAEDAECALYVGDDTTDEDVFKLDEPGRLLTLRIGESASSSARYFLREQLEIDRLLARLVGLGEGRVAL